MGIILSVQNYATFFPLMNNKQGSHWFSLYRENLGDQFWTYLYGNRYYHIIRPWEGIGFMAILTVFYAGIDPIYYRALARKSDYL